MEDDEERRGDITRRDKQTIEGFNIEEQSE